jgi:hypothetical protein
MKRTKRVLSSAFKAEVALEAIKGVKTVSELALGKLALFHFASFFSKLTIFIFYRYCLRLGLHMYLLAIIDLKSRYIVGWSLSNTIETS